MEALYDQRDRLQAQISARSLEFRELTRIPSIEEVAHLLIPSGTALEFFTLTAPEGSDVRYYALVWTPRGVADVREIKGPLYLAPDAALAGGPFDLLPVSGDQALGDRYQVSLIGSVRDLARWGRQEASRIDEVGFFDPEFGPAPAGQRPDFVRLASTRAEADVLKRHWPRFQALMGREASKTKLFDSRMAGPRRTGVRADNSRSSRR